MIFVPVNTSSKSRFSCCSNFVLSWVDKVTTGTDTGSFVSVILNFVSLVAEEITQSLDQVKID